MQGAGLWSWFTRKPPMEERVELEEPGWTWMTRVTGSNQSLQKSHTGPLCPPLIHASHTPSTEKNCGLVIAGDISSLEKDYLKRDEKRVPLGETLFRRFSSTPVESGAQTPTTASSSIIDRVNNLKIETKQWDKALEKRHHKSRSSKHVKRHIGSREEGQQSFSENPEKKHHRSRSNIKNKHTDDPISDLTLKNADCNIRDLQHVKSADKTREFKSLSIDGSKEQTRPLWRSASRERTVPLSTASSKDNEVGITKIVSRHLSLSPSKENTTSSKPLQSGTPASKNMSKRVSREGKLVMNRPPKCPSPKRGNRSNTPSPTLTQESFLASTNSSSQDNLSRRASSVGPLTREGSSQDSLTKKGANQGNLSKNVSSSESPSGKAGNKTAQKSRSKSQSTSKKASPLDQPSSPSSTLSRSPTPKTSTITQAPAFPNHPDKVLTSPGTSYRARNLDKHDSLPTTPSKGLTPKTSSVMTAFILPDKAPAGRCGPPNTLLSKRGRSFDANNDDDNDFENASEKGQLLRSYSSKHRESNERTSRRDKYESNPKQHPNNTFREALENYFEVNKRESNQDRDRIANALKPGLHRGKNVESVHNSAKNTNQQSDTHNKKISIRTAFEHSHRTPPNESRTPPPRRTRSRTAPSERRALSVGPNTRGTTSSDMLSGIERRREHATTKDSCAEVLTKEQKRHNLISQAIANDTELARRAGSSFQTMIGRILSHDPSIFGKPKPVNPEMEPGHERQTQITRQTRKQVTKNLEMRGTNQHGEEQTTVFRFQEQGCRIQHQDSANPEKNVDQTMTRNVQSVIKDGETTRVESPISLYRHSATPIDVNDTAVSQTNRVASPDQKSITVGRLSPSLWDGRISPTPMKAKLRPKGIQSRNYSTTPPPMLKEKKSRTPSPRGGPVSSAPGDASLDAKGKLLFSLGRFPLQRQKRKHP